MRRFILVSALLVLAVDALAAAASRELGFRYESLALVSAVMYALIGFVGARRTTMMRAAIATGIVGLVDATLGWAIQTALHPTGEAITAGAIAVVVVLVPFTATFLGLAGAFLERFIFSRRQVGG